MPECVLEFRDNFYSEEILRKVDYGCYSPSVFRHKTVSGVYGAYIHEGCCPIHGVVISPLGGISMVHYDSHPCGAYKQDENGQPIILPVEKAIERYKKTWGDGAAVEWIHTLYGMLKQRDK